MGRLVLDRYRDKRRIDIILPDGREIEVYLVDWSAAGIRLAIEAPPDVQIVRHELRERETE